MVRDVLFYILLGVTLLYTGVYVALWSVEKIKHLLNEGPARDRFKAMAKDLGECRDMLVDYLDPPEPLYPPGPLAKVSAGALILGQMETLTDQLMALGIPVPDVLVG